MHSKKQKVTLEKNEDQHLTTLDDTPNKDSKASKATVMVAVKIAI